MNAKKPKLAAETEAVNITTDLAAKSFDRAEAAFNKAGEIAHENVQVFDAAAGAFKSRAADLQLKAMEIAQLNVNAAFTFARKAFSAKAPADLLTLNQEFVKGQMETYSRQMAEMNELFVLLAKETAKPMQEGMTKSWTSFGKSFAA